MRLIVECSSCGGTGLYSGMCEGKGKAVVCLGCKGSGAEVVVLRRYTGRKHYRGIKEIKFSRGRSILSCGGTGESLTYKQFKEKIPPQDIKEARKTYAQLGVVK
jgi:DnaJ-class molecular chaperone